MALDISQLRAAFSKKSESSGEDNTGFWDKFYPFFKMDMDTSARFRFVPDRDEENPLGFIVPNQYHQLLINGKKKSVACLKMYGESCPCCERSSQYYNEGNESLGKSFWRKIDYIAQGVIISSPFDYPIKADENPVRLISMSPKLYKIIETKIVKGDMDEMPTDFQNGYDFVINKTKQGEYADYSTSDFARKSTPISDDNLARIDLYDLKNYRYAKVAREQMEAMIEAFLTGKNYDNEKSNSGHDTGNSTLDAKLNSDKPTQSVDAVVQQSSSVNTANQGDSAPAAKLSPQEILARLRARQSGN